MASHKNDAPIRSLITFWDEMAQDDSGLLSGRTTSPADVHRLRLAAKQLRAHLRLVRPGVNPEWFKAEDLALRDAGKQLSSLRDDHVMVKSLVSLPKALSSPKLWHAVRESIEAHNATPPNSLPPDMNDSYQQSGIAVPEVAAALRSHTHEMIHTVQPGVGWDLINQGLRHTYKKSRQHLDSWRHSQNPQCAHRLRRQVKYLAFQTGFLVPFTTKTTEKQTVRLHELERTLGKLNDLRLVESRLRSLETEATLNPDSAELIRHALGSKQKRLNKRAWKLAKSVFSPSPSAFLRVLRSPDRS
ncbi:MAG: CHAD domain-containing protein [Verrucomicrobiota bacterium]